jgi:DNA invertase Pin-like site-specific DNA recombinase
MISAIYARKSTEQNGVADDAKSVQRQIEHATAYTARKGWTVLDEHVYVDHAISGAEFERRPGFVRLMAALKPRAPFQTLVMSEESRLGREAIETAYALKQLVQAGVQVWFSLEDRQRTLDTPTDKIMPSAWFGTSPGRRASPTASRFSTSAWVRRRDRHATRTRQTPADDGHVGATVRRDRRHD